MHVSSQSLVKQYIRVNIIMYSRWLCVYSCSCKLHNINVMPSALLLLHVLVIQERSRGLQRYKDAGLPTTSTTSLEINMSQSSYSLTTCFNNNIIMVMFGQLVKNIKLFQIYK